MLPNSRYHKCPITQFTWRFIYLETYYDASKIAKNLCILDKKVDISQIIMYRLRQLRFDIFNYNYCGWEKVEIP